MSRATVQMSRVVEDCSRRWHQKLHGKARLPTVERLNGGTASWLVEVDRSLCRDGTCATRVKYDDRSRVANLLY